MDWMNFPYIDVTGIGGAQQDGAPTFRATTDCPFNWEWIALAFVAGALVVYYAKR